MPKTEFEFVPFYHERLVGDSSVVELRKSREDEGTTFRVSFWENRKKKKD